jgi:hypothetical protein
MFAVESLEMSLLIAIDEQAGGVNSSTSATTSYGRKQTLKI